MPTPTKSGEFLDLVRNSGVLEDKELDTFLQENPDLPDDPKGVAERLVQAGLMTRFQTALLLRNKLQKLIISGKYKLLDRLGAGGMGTVYLCEHRIMRRRVALKVLPNAVAKDPSAVERFHREARACAALDHPNIARAHDVDQDGKMHFLVIEYVEGASLLDLVRQQGTMDVRRAADCIRQAALGLQHAHEAGLVHRDVKPANLLLDRKGVLKILDMGLALFFQDNDDNITKQYDDSAILGTADYLAPEQGIDSHNVDIRADVYSLGLTFYFLLTGQSPYGEGTIPQKLLWHQMKKPKSVRESRPDVPEGIDAIIERMIAKKAEDRFQTPQEIADVLKPWAEGNAGVNAPAPETISNLKAATNLITPPPAKADATRVLRKSRVELPPPAKTGSLPADKPGSGKAAKSGANGKVPSENTTADKPGSGKAAKSGANGKEPSDKALPRPKKARKPQSPLMLPAIIVMAVTGVVLVAGAIWLALRPSSPGKGSGSNQVAAVTPADKSVVQPPGVTPNPVPPATPPKPPPATPPKPPPATPPKPPPVQNPPKPAPPAPTVTADFFPYHPAMTLHYVQVNYVSDGMGVALDQKNEFKENGVVDVTTTRTGLVQGGKYLAGAAVQWGLSPQLIKKFQVKVGKSFYPLHVRIENNTAEVGQHLLSSQDVFWEPILKIGGKQGDSWEWKLPNGVSKKFIVEKFDRKDGKEAVLVKSTAPTGQPETEMVTHYVFARGVGEVERRAELVKKGAPATTVMEMKLVPD